MGNRALKRKREKRIIKNKLRIILIIFIIYIIFNVIYGMYNESQIKLLEESSMSEKQQIIEKSNVIIKEEKKEKVNIQKTYKNYEVCAKLIIPKIELETYILSEYTKEKMDVAPTKFWGCNPNEVGNFCVTGHNYKKENMFSELINLKIGDEIYLLDNKNGKYVYKIYDIYKVKPNNITPLEQDTAGKRIITLITCVNYSNNRLIVQAVEN